jgi:tetratricopeptide (TPR) repeat protein
VRTTLAIALCLVAASAAAQQPVREQAEDLFLEGVHLFKDGKFDEACPKLEASLRLDPILSTRFMVARCYEAIGRIASAWSMWSVILKEAEAQGARGAERAERAREYVSKLTPRLTRLAIVAPKEATVTVNGQALTTPAPIPIDPGTHTIGATAPGHMPWSKTIDVTSHDEGKVLNVEVKLQPEAAAKPPERPAPEPAPAEERPSSSRHVIALVVGGAGVAMIAVGSVFGVMARSSWNDSRSDCDETGCGPTGYDQALSAYHKGNIATVLVGVGVAAVGTGVILWLTAPKEGATQARIAPSVGPGSVGVTVTGAF